MLCLKVAGFLGRCWPAFKVEVAREERKPSVMVGRVPERRSDIFFVSTAVIRLSFAGGRFAGKHVARKKDTNRLHTLRVDG